MKHTSILSMSALLLCGTLTACGGDGHYNHYQPPAADAPKTLSVEQVLSTAQSSSDTADPISVTDPVTTIAGHNDETADPVEVN